jgi:hypothetical protein
MCTCTHVAAVLAPLFHTFFAITVQALLTKLHMSLSKPQQGMLNLLLDLLMFRPKASC